MPNASPPIVTAISTSNPGSPTDFPTTFGYRKISDAVGLSQNTIRKHIRSLEERGLLVTEPTQVTTKDDRKRNGNLLFTIRPIQAALQQDYGRQMQKLTEDAARRKYADFIENRD